MGTSTNVRPRVAPALVFLVSAGLVAACIGVSPASSAPSVSPEGRVLVVTANLQEAWGERDLQDMSEMKVFARRLIDLAPYVPDVLLLQDVRRRSARYTADVLSRITGNTFAVAHRLRAKPWHYGADGKSWIMTETTIVVNTNTMARREAGFLRVRDPWSVKHNYRSYRRQAHARVIERQSGADIGLASVHLPKSPRRSSTIAKRYARWSHKLASSMGSEYPSSRRVIGGDFNQTRCADKSRPCKPSPFWTELNGFGYTEALWEVQRQKHWSDRLPLGVDFIFTNGGVDDAGGDEDPPQFYSDHRFFWAVLPV